MSSTKLLLKKVKMLERVLTPKPPRDIVIMFTFGRDDEPHGKYGHRLRNMLTGECEPVELAVEIEQLRDYYETKVPQHAKRQHDGYSWATFTDFLKSNECKCGSKHPYYNPDCRFTNKWKMR